MKLRVILAAAALALAACSGNFSTGTGMPQPGNLPPMGGTPMPEVNQNGLPQAQPGVSASPGAQAGTTSYAIADAQKGFACPPTQDGYGCTLSFNLPEPTPTPSPQPKRGKNKSKSTPTPSPTPSPSPTPTDTPDTSGGESPSPKPTPTPASVTLNAKASPADAPKMVHIPEGTLDTVALMMVQITSNGDFPLNGWVNAQFTLPKAQLDGRGFAVQLFSVTKNKKNLNYKPIWTFDKSTLNDTTLTFSFKPPKMTIAKGSTYTLVLYGDDKSTASGSAAPSASVSPSASPSAAPSPSASPIE